MQLAFNQPKYDIMIPIYFGDSAKWFDHLRLAVAVLKVPRGPVREFEPWRLVFAALAGGNGRCRTLEVLWKAIILMPVALPGRLCVLMDASQLWWH